MPSLCSQSDMLLPALALLIRSASSGSKNGSLSYKFIGSLIAYPFQRYLVIPPKGFNCILGWCCPSFQVKEHSLFPKDMFGIDLKPLKITLLSTF